MVGHTCITKIILGHPKIRIISCFFARGFICQSLVGRPKGGGGYQWGHLNELPPTLLEIQLSGVWVWGVLLQLWHSPGLPLSPGRGSRPQPFSNPQAPPRLSYARGGARCQTGFRETQPRQWFPGSHWRQRGGWMVLSVTPIPSPPRGREPFQLSFIIFLPSFLSC